jgi:hypothetical protein
MTRTTATVLGFVAASIFPAAVLSVSSPLGGKLTIGSVAVSFFVSYPFSAAFTLLFGLPAFLLLRRFGSGRWWSVLGVGFLLGIPVTIAIRLPHSPNLNDLLINGPLAAGSTLLFWWIWRRGNNLSK